jgi:hypothetical protein
MPRPVWWVVSNEAMRELLVRAHDGEDPDLLMAENYANARHENVD